MGEPHPSPQKRINRRSKSLQLPPPPPPKEGFPGPLRPLVFWKVAIIIDSIYLYLFLIVFIYTRRFLKTCDAVSFLNPLKRLLSRDLGHSMLLHHHFRGDVRFLFFFFFFFFCLPHIKDRYPFYKLSTSGNVSTVYVVYVWRKGHSPDKNISKTSKRDGPKQVNQKSVAERFLSSHTLHLLFKHFVNLGRTASSVLAGSSCRPGSTMA